jgi:hypothetical protein
MNEDLKQPEGLSPLGIAAYDCIMNFLVKNNLTNTGGCPAFKSPQEWRDRGEECCRYSHLIVVYDGGDLREAFMEDECYTVTEKLDHALEGLGLYFEHGTNWYGGIYEI